MELGDGVVTQKGVPVRGWRVLQSMESHIA